MRNRLLFGVALVLLVFLLFKGKLRTHTSSRTNETSGSSEQFLSPSDSELEDHSTHTHATSKATLCESTPDGLQKCSEPTKPTASRLGQALQSIERATTLEQWSQALNQALQQAPKTADIQKLSDEQLHQTPQIVIEFGEVLGAIEERVDDHATFAAGALTFYRSCGKNDTFPQSVRAVCVANYLNHAQRLNRKVSDTEFDPALRERAQQLMNESFDD